MIVAAVRRVRRRVGTSFKVIDGEAIVVLPHTGEYKILNGVGSLVWQLLDGTRNLEGIVERVCEEFEVAPERARGDVEEFLEELERSGMLAEG